MPLLDSFSPPTLTGFLIDCLRFVAQTTHNFQNLYIIALYRAKKCICNHIFHKNIKFMVLTFLVSHTFSRNLGLAESFGCKFVIHPSKTYFSGAKSSMFLEGNTGYYIPTDCKRICSCFCWASWTIQLITTNSVQFSMQWALIIKYSNEHNEQLDVVIMVPLDFSMTNISRHKGLPLALAFGRCGSWSLVCGRKRWGEDGKNTGKYSLFKPWHWTTSQDLGCLQHVWHAL